MLQELLEALGGGAQRQDMTDLRSGIEVPDAEGYKNLAKGSLAATAGLGGDLENVAKAIVQARMGYADPRLEGDTFMPTSQEVGDSLGADVDSTGFGVGEFFSADPLSKLGKLGGLASVLVARRASRGDPYGLRTDAVSGKFDNIIDALNKRTTNFDPRFDDRVGTQQRMHDLKVGYNKPDNPIDPASIFDYEGRGFVTTMSDRVGAQGEITNIGDVELNFPINTQGGQGNMNTTENINKGQVWGSHDIPLQKMHQIANELYKQTGKEPLLLPWRMAPTGGDFNPVTGQLMMSYAQANMDQATKAELDDAIRNYVSVGTWDKKTQKQKGAGYKIADFKGIDDPEGYRQFEQAPDVLRKELKNMMDKNFRDKGGLSIGEARIAVADPQQLNAPDSGLQNMGIIHPNRDLLPDSGQAAYAKGLGGNVVGEIQEDLSAFDLGAGADAYKTDLDNVLTQLVRSRGVDPMNPTPQDMRALQMKPYGGILTNEVLRSISR